MLQAVGCEDQTVRIISLDPDSTLETISLQVWNNHHGIIIINSDRLLLLLPFISRL